MRIFSLNISFYKSAPFGSPLIGRTYQAGALVEYRFGFNGKEKINEISGDRNDEDFGERIYDSRLGKFKTIDRYASKYPYFSPYSYAGNNPIAIIDLQGDSLYILCHVVGGTKESDDMLKAAAETRKSDIENSGHFDPAKDKVVILEVSDVSTIKYNVEATVAENKATYGNTVEFGVWSHAGFDGPVGSSPASADPLYKGSYQMNLTGWGKINFNWEIGVSCVAGFYGCNTGNSNSTGKDKVGISFATKISGLSNFKDVAVLGQTKASYPSKYTNTRNLTFSQLIGDFLPLFQESSNTIGVDGPIEISVIRKTYMVGGDSHKSKSAFFTETKAYQMQRSKNGKVQGKQFQKGDKN